MISLSLAVKLKESGLTWQPTLHDFFAIPQPELEDRLFVLSDMTIDIEPRRRHLPSGLHAGLLRDETGRGCRRGARPGNGSRAPRGLLPLARPVWTSRPAC
jgi:hypothetical protein